jgi:hydrophobic/amphiphilic exporter-1 (mainly G- bacteria), HAE1 family
MALVALAVLGLISYSRLPAELNPRVDIPTLTVTTVLPGASPQEVETLVTRPLEDAVGAVNNVRDVFSSSQDSVSIISMDFTVGTDLEMALTAVREKVEAARTLLPPDAQAPLVARLDINAQPVLYLGLSTDSPILDLRDAVDDRLRPRLARVPGVATVTVVGGEEREIKVAVSADRLKQHGITIEDVVNAVKAANRSVPAGSITHGRREIAVRTVGAFTHISDISQAQIFAPQLMMAAPGPPMAGGGGTGAPAPLTVGDVATVSSTTSEPETITRVNGRDSVGLIITKVADANTVTVVDGVKEALARNRSALPPGTNIVYSRDESIVVRDALEDVNVTLILGAILAMAVVFVFLHNLRGTIIVALALPACMVATFLVMYFAGFTLNQMTLLALSLSVGILIDDSIVVLESITRHLARGEPPAEAAYNGRTEIGFADVTTTLVDVVVFLPIAFMGGIVGAFFRQFGLTIVVATLFSLIVSFTVTPSLAARWYRQGEDPEAVTGGPFARLERLYRAMERLYRGILRRAMANRGWVIAFAAVVVIAGFLITLPSIGTDLLPATDQGQVAITIEMEPGASLATTDAVMREAEQRVARTPDVLNEVTTVGEILGGFGSIPQRGSQFGQINVRLKQKAGLLDSIAYLGAAPASLRTRTDEAVASDLRRRLRDVAGSKIKVMAVRSAASIGAPIQVQLRGPNLDELARAGSQIRDRMARLAGIVDPDISVRTGRPEVQVRLDRHRAAAAGVPIAQAAAIVRTAVEGNRESTFRESGNEYPIHVQLAEVDRNEPDELRDVTVGFSKGTAVTLGQVADLGSGSGPVAIDRINGQRMITISAGLTPGFALGNAEGQIRELLRQITMPGIEVHFGGEAEALNENIPYFALSLGLAVILVYLVMASLFNSLLNPFIIMFTLPMALVGALGALAITGETLSLVSMIGIIMLTGLMGRNAILLIDYTSTLRSRGMPRDEAVEQAGVTRLRPILMTTLATIFGMLPVALRIGRASEMRAPMAIVVIGGLLVSTVLTLVVIPVLYTLFDDLVSRRRRLSPATKAGLP